MPSHAHSIGAQTNGTAGATNVPGTSVMLGTATTSQPGNPQVLAYGSSPPNAQMLPINAFGGSQPHENRMPFLAMNYCIALTGIFPSRS
jgi:microcystin-dependent protein